MNDQYAYLHIQKVTYTFRGLMGESSICIHAHSESLWVNAQYVYIHIQTVDG